MADAVIEAAMLVPPDEVFDEDVRQAMEKELGLDRPIMVQYVDWLWHALQGDFGESIFTQLPVWGLIVERVPATLYLAIAAIVLAIIVAIPLGTIAALRKNTMTDYIAMGTSIFGLTVPNFWLALILILVFSLGLRWFPSMEYIDPTQDFFGSLKHFVMLAVVLAVSPCAIATRMTCSSMLDERNKEYIYTARSQGLPEWKIIARNHGARIARRLLSNTALIVSRLTFYAAFDATTFSLTANGEISYLGALALINVLPAPWGGGEGGSVSTGGYALTPGAPWQIFEEGCE